MVHPLQQKLLNLQHYVSQIPPHQNPAIRSLVAVLSQQQQLDAQMTQAAEDTGKDCFELQNAPVTQETDDSSINPLQASLQENLTQSMKVGFRQFQVIERIMDLKMSIKHSEPGKLAELAKITLQSELNPESVSKSELQAANKELETAGFAVGTEGYQKLLALALLQEEKAQLNDLLNLHAKYAEAAFFTQLSSVIARCTGDTPE